MADRDESGIMNDERFKWLKQRAVQSLRVKDDKWNRLMDDDDVTTTAITFFENEMIQTIFIYQNELDELVMSEHPPARIADKKKAVYFTKTAAFQKIEKNKTPAEIMYGDISDNVLLTLQAEMDGVFIPLLKQATTGWPELLQKDIQQQCDQFSQQIAIIKGRMQNQYILPLNSEKVEELLIQLKIIRSGKRNELYPDLPLLATNQQNILSVLPQNIKDQALQLEQITLEWIKQIRNLTNLQPEDVLANKLAQSRKKNPTPNMEIEFWEGKFNSCSNLICTLLRPEYQNVFLVLKLIGSSYHDALMQHFLELQNECAKCYSNYRFLGPIKELNSYFNDFQLTREQLVQGLDAFFYAMQQITLYSPFYGESTRFTFVMRSFANLLIDWGVLFLSQGNDNGRDVIKTVEIPQMIQNVQFVCQICDTMIEKYADASQEVSNKLSEAKMSADEEAAKRSEVLGQLVAVMMNQYNLDNNKYLEEHYKKLQAENKLVDGDELIKYTDNGAGDDIKYDKSVIYRKQSEKWPQMAMVFKRLESFIERLKDIHKVLQIRNAFENLNPDKFEVGGVQGDKLSVQLARINAVFNDKIQIFTEANYDATDVAEAQFNDDMTSFMSNYVSLERRLTSILEQAVESSITIEQAIMCFEVFSEVLNENILKAMAMRVFPQLNNRFKTNLETVIAEFQSQKEKPTLEPNMPEQSGRVFWARVCINRVRLPFIKLEALYNAYLNQEVDEVFEQNKLKYSQFVSIVNDYEKQIYEMWSQQVNDRCVEKLEEFLLRRQEIQIIGLPAPNEIEQDENGEYVQHIGYQLRQGEKQIDQDLCLQRNYQLDKPILLQTNFSAELFSILSETKLFKILNKIIPERAQEVYDKGNDYRQLKNQLDDIVAKYNYVQKNLFYVERPLFYSQIEQIEALLVRGTSEFKWTAWKDDKAEVEQFVKSIKLPIDVLYSQVITLKEQLNQTNGLLKSWSRQPLIEKPQKQVLQLDKILPLINTKIQSFRRENLTKFKQNKDEVWDVDVEKVNVNVSVAKNAVFLDEVENLYQLDEQGREMAAQMANLKNDEGRLTRLKQYWDAYLVWLSQYIQNGLLQIIVQNIINIQQYMDSSETTEHNDFYQQNITPNEQSHPFLEINMNISHQRLYFEPECNEETGQAGVQTLAGTVQSWINQICKVCDIVFNPITSSSIESLRQSTLRDFQQLVKRDPKFVEANQKLLDRVRRKCQIALQQTQIIDEFTDLYKTDKRQYLQRFLQDGPNVPLRDDYTVDPDAKQKVVRTIIQTKQQIDDAGATGGDNDGDDEVKNRAQDDDEDMEAKIVQVEEELYVYRKPDIWDFNELIEKYQKLYDQIQVRVPQSIRLGWLSIKCQNAKVYLLDDANAFKDLFINNRIEEVNTKLTWLQHILSDAQKILNTEFSSENFEKAMKTLQEIKTNQMTIDQMFEPMKQIIQMLQRRGKTLDPEILKLFEVLPKQWQDVKSISMGAKEKLAPLQAAELNKLTDAIKQFSSKVLTYHEGFKNEAPFRYAVGVDNAYIMMDKAIVRLGQLRENANELLERQELFDQQLVDKNANQDELQQIAQMEKELKLLKHIWDLADVVESQVKEWKKSLFIEVNTEQLQDTISKFTKQQVKMDQICKAYNVYKELDQLLKNFLQTIPLITNLRDKSMRERHWQELMRKTGVKFIIDENFRLSNLLDLNLHQYQEDVSEIVDSARKELVQESQLENLKNVWKGMNFNFYAATDSTQTPLTSDQIHQMLASNELFLVQVPEELVTQLEQDQMVVSAMAGSTVQFFAPEVNDWQKKLSNLDSIIQTWTTVQRTWGYLKPIFKFSEDIRRQLPDDTKRFEQIDVSWVNEMNKIVRTPNALVIADQKEFLATLERDLGNLVKCEKALADYLDTKRRLFPRFYFVSQVDLLDILSKGQTPRLVERHLSKIFDNIHSLRWADPDDMDCKAATSFLSGEKEEVPFLSCQQFKCVGQVEMWLNELVNQTRQTLKINLSKALNQYLADENKTEWLEKTLAQICIVALQIYWTSETQNAFDKMAENNENAMKEYNKRQQDALFSYISMIQGNLTPNMRTKISTICTIEVHSKDIVANLIKDKVQNAQAFAWQSQLKFYWDEKLQDCVVRICDADFMYSYEYLGCQSRLVITPLTDRCYITLTQSLHLNLGGAPAGPAGTGKTETTKDLGRALGRMVYVFNCSAEMDYRSLGNIFYGLSLSGSWGCFDEFNRISIEVLSVVAMQVKSVLDAIRAKKEYFTLEGDEEEKPNMPKAKLNRQVGYFITMNPGYAGRTELPDNLKALFRAMSMVVPDFCQITEIMLISNGFMSARHLAQKFTTLYSLNKELLSKAYHYDWGLRAIIAICRTAGTLRRQMIKSNDDKKAEALANKSFTANKSFSREK